VQVTLLAESTEEPRRPLNVPMGLRLGRPVGSDCSDVLSGVYTPSFKAHLEVVLEAGVYCIQLSDVGSLSERVGALVRVVHPAPLDVPQPNTQTAASNITVGGSFGRTIEIGARGVLNITLTDLQPSVPVGLGVGLRAEGSGICRLSQVVTTTAATGPQFTLPVDPGEYCLEIFDVGNFTQLTSFTLQIQHP
jgi:hypothetical protein